MKDKKTIIKHKVKMISGIKSRFIKISDFIQEIAIRYINEDITLKAAGLAFYQLLILIPLMILLFFLIAKVFNNPEIYNEVVKTTAFGKEHIVKAIKTITESLTNKGFIFAVIGFFIYFFLTRKYLRELIFTVRKIIGQKDEPLKDFKSGIFRYLKNLMLQYLWIFIFVVIITASSLLTSIAYSSMVTMEKMTGSMPVLVSIILRIFLILIPLTFYMLFHYFLYWYTPHIKPKKKFALIGAVIATIVNALLRFLYTFYINKILESSSLPQTDAIQRVSITSALIIKATFKMVAALVIWFFLSSIIVLLGAILVKILDNRYSK